MPSYKENNGNWYCSFYHNDWKGNRLERKRVGLKQKEKQWNGKENL